MHWSIRTNLIWACVVMTASYLSYFLWAVFSASVASLETSHSPSDSCEVQLDVLPLTQRIIEVLINVEVC